WLQGGATLVLGVVFVAVFLRSEKKTSVRILADSGASETFKVCPDPEQAEQLQEYYELLRELIASAKGTAGGGNRKHEGGRAGGHNGVGCEHADGPRFTACPSCGVEIKIKPAFLGRRANCPSCRKPFLVS